MDEINTAVTQPVILLTGCINPEGMTFTKLKNPETRRLQYIETINFYLDNTNNLIVFVENSGVDISKTFQNSAHRSRLEIFTFIGNDFDKRLGKGHGEMIIMQHAFQHSRFIRTNNSVCKITGRYKALNIKPILRTYEKYKCNVMVDLLCQLKYSDSRIFIADKSFFTDFLFSTIDLINDSEGYYLEHALNRAVLFSIMEGKYSYLPFKYKPRLKGLSGTDNLNYDYSFSYWFPLNIKQIIRFKVFSRKLEIKFSN